MPSPQTANVGKAVAARVGVNIREVRTRLGMTQAQLATPDFSISYISAIERGKIRPSLKALSILAHRLDVPLTFLLEGSPSGASEARAVGYSPSDAGPDARIDVDLLLANVMLQQGDHARAEQLLSPIQPERITTDQVYHLYVLRGQVHLVAGAYQEAVVDLRSAVSQAEALSDPEYTGRARNLLGEAYHQLSHYTLAMENHRRCHAAIEKEKVGDPVFALSVFSNLANDYYRLGDVQLSIQLYQKALETLDAMKRDAQSFAHMYLEISQSYKEMNKLAMAGEYALRSLALYEMRHEQRLGGITHQRLGEALEKQHDLSGAEQEYRKAIAIEDELNDEVAASLCHTMLSELLLTEKRLPEAEHEAQQALIFGRSSGNAQAQGQALMVLALIRHQEQDDVSADELFTQALSLLDASNAHEIAASAYFRFANLLEEQGQMQRSLSAIKKAYEHQRLGSRSHLE